MPTERKERLLKELKEKLERCTIAVATDYRGLSATALSELRQKLREKGIEYKVVKNTIAGMASEAVGRPALKGIIEGPTAIAFGFGDPVDVAKVLEEYIRSTRSSLTVRGAITDGRAITPAEFFSLATLPPRQELIARVVGQIQAPLSRLLAVLNAPLSGLLTLLQRRVEQLEKGEAAGVPG